MNQPLAYVHPQAKIANNVVIEPFVNIEKNVIIEEGTWIGSNVTIMEGARIGKTAAYFLGLLSRLSHKTSSSTVKKHWSR